MELKSGLGNHRLHRYSGGSVSEVTARAYPNIALVKYWGKRDETLVLPEAGSLSMTLDIFATTTTVELLDAPPQSAASARAKSADEFQLNGAVLDPSTDSAAQRVSEFLNLVREAAGSSRPARVTSINEAPTAAGLASSASGFAALASAASHAYGLRMDTPTLSRLARRGSGSACRSVVSKFALWHAGNDDHSSFAEQIEAPDMRMIICKINGEQKSVSSRDGMRLTAESSPFYEGWITSTESLLQRALRACAEDDFTALGELTEMHAFRMHAVIQSTEPPIHYLAPASYAAFNRLAQLRRSGIETYGTADAGPNVVAISRPEDADAVQNALSEFGETVIAAPGSGAQLIPDKV
jgi:diphosphomevalonate decarboxylase